MSFPPPTVSAPPPAGPPSTPADDDYPRWPLWAPLLALALGLPVLFMVISLSVGVAGLDEDSPWTSVIAGLATPLCVGAAVVVVAGMTERPRPRHFGFRPAPLGGSLLAIVTAAVLFYGFAAIYGALVREENPQTIVEDLGANESTLLLVVGALVVIVAAPIGEELFFRGFLFRVLRTRLSFWIAATITGVLFGIVHAGLIVVPILAVFGLLLCWVYERTGSLFPAIALHALNNTLVYGVTTEDGAAVAGVVGGVMLLACMATPALLRPRPA